MAAAQVESVAEQAVEMERQILAVAVGEQVTKVPQVAQVAQEL